jgi:hypothetical protein
VYSGHSVNEPARFKFWTIDDPKDLIDAAIAGFEPGYPIRAPESRLWLEHIGAGAENE